MYLDVQILFNNLLNPNWYNNNYIRTVDYLTELSSGSMYCMFLE